MSTRTSTPPTSAAAEQRDRWRTLADLERTAALLAWLREYEHSAGRRLSPDDLLTRATGAPPDAAPFLDSLETQFAAPYGLEEVR